MRKIGLVLCDFTYFQCATKKAFFWSPCFGDRQKLKEERKEAKQAI